MNNTNTQIDISDMQLQVYDYKSIDEYEVLKKATEIAYVYVPDADEGQYYVSKYKNIKKVHIFTYDFYKSNFKQFENDSRYKIYYIDEYEKDPFKYCDAKFDFIDITRLDIIFENTIANDPIFNMKILNDAINHLNDENSVLHHCVEGKYLAFIKSNKKPNIFKLQTHDFNLSSINIEDIYKSVSDIAIVCCQYPDSFKAFKKYHNIKKIHLFTSIDYKDNFKSVENNSRYKIWFVDEKDPLKNCDEKFDCIIINRNYKGYNCILSEDAIKHLKDENSAVIDRVDSRGPRYWYVYKLCKQQVNNPINF